jgi:hypothetical protein
MITILQVGSRQNGADSASRPVRRHLTGAVIVAALAAGIAAPVAALGGAGLKGATHIGTAVGAGAEPARYAARLDAAFSLVEEAAIDPAMAERIAAAARKADRLVPSVGCDGQTWPAIEPQCLVPGDDAARAAARMVTVEYRLGDSTSVLVRRPSRIAGR